jgi:hypothetical protein
LKPTGFTTTCHFGAIKEEEITQKKEIREKVIEKKRKEIHRN